MENHSQYSIADFDYNLPEAKIAKYPLQQRDRSKLLVYRNGEISDEAFIDAPNFLSSHSLLVFNNTRVIHARMSFYKKTGARIEVFCLEPVEPAAYETIFLQRDFCVWKCIVGNAKKWKQDVLELHTQINGKKVVVAAEQIEKQDDAFRIRFSWQADVSFSEILESVGEVPIPPYLQRKTESIDSDRYQTIYAQHEGSVAAPTAGLHFTDEVLARISAKHIEQKQVVLHVGAGTFKPVQQDDFRNHAMHRECCIVSKEVIRSIINAPQCIAVGTTSVRTLESLYWLGVKLLHYNRFISELDQWDAYELPQDVSVETSCNALLAYLEKEGIDSVSAYTQLMIMPGYTFRVVDAMFTNFHQPKSTLLLLVAAFVGEDWKKIYTHALQSEYRFLSYGDSMLLHKSL